MNTDTRAAKRRKIAGQEEHVVILTVPRIFSFCDTDTLLALRCTSKTCLNSVDQEVLDRSKEIVMKLPKQYRRHGFKISRDILATGSFTDEYASRQSIVEKAMVFAQPLYDLVQERSDSTINIQNAKQLLLQSGRAFVYTGAIPWTMHCTQKSATSLTDTYENWSCFRKDFSKRFFFATETVMQAEFQHLLEEIKVLCMPSAQAHFQWKIRKVEFGYRATYLDRIGRITTAQLWAYQFEGNPMESNKGAKPTRLQLEGRFTLVD